MRRVALRMRTAPPPAAVPAAAAAPPTPCATRPTPRARSVLLQITAMRYSCLTHGNEDECMGDVKGWCQWAPERGTCALSFDDADFVGLLLWSSISLACKGSLLADVVKCSHELYRRRARAHAAHGDPRMQAHAGAAACVHGQPHQPHA